MDYSEQMPQLATRIARFYGTHLPHPGHWRLVNLLVEILHLDPGGELKLRAQGLTWHLDPRDYVQKDLFWFGVKDRWEMRHLRELINAASDPVCLDVGANFGYYSLLLAVHCRRVGRVFAFEPIPQTANRLMKNIDENGLSGTIQVKRVALGATAGRASLGKGEGDTGKTFLSEPTESGETVPVTTLDRFVAEERLEKVDFIKLDVEGFEPSVVQGGMESLKRWHPLLFMELNPSTLQRRGFTAESLLSDLRTLGYHFLVAQRTQLVPLKELPDKGDVVNVFCVHP